MSKITKEDYHEQLTKKMFLRWKKSQLNLYNITKYKKIRKQVTWKDVQKYDTLYHMDANIVKKWYDDTKGCRNATIALGKMEFDKTKDVDFDWWTKRCINCNKKNVDLKRCSVCKVVYYCDALCQKDDWGKHKVECVTHHL